MVSLTIRSIPSQRWTRNPCIIHRLISPQCYIRPPRLFFILAKASSTHESSPELSEDYSETMQQRMGNTALMYRHEDGMNYTRILDDLIVGSCLQKSDDVDLLATKENVKTVLSLQEDCDMEFFSLDLLPIQERCQARSDIQHVRHRVRDFDPHSLRVELPGAVAALSQAAEINGGTAYVHCTAGMGRAPAVALAFMWWIKGIHLEDAHALLTSKRHCSPRLPSIRAAAADLLYGGPPTPVEIELFRWGDASDVKVAGLDVGWGVQLPLERDVPRARWVLKRDLPPGLYQYKLIFDGRWSYSADHPTLRDGDNVNNYVEVAYSSSDPEEWMARERILTSGTKLTDEEIERLRHIVLTELKSNGGVGMY